MKAQVRPRARRRRRLFQVLATVLGSLLALASVEVVLRNVDVVGRNYPLEFGTYMREATRFAWGDGQPKEADLDGYLFRSRPNLDMDLGSFRLQTNEYGFRGPGVQVPKPDGVFRILLLGDSVAFGWGVDDGVTFARRLEMEWNARGGARRLEVVNTGNPIYDTVQEAATLKETLPLLTPDLVVLVYVVHDIEPSRDLVEALFQGAKPIPAEVVELPDDAWIRCARWIEPVLPSTAEFLRCQSDVNARVLATLPPGAEYKPEGWGKGPRGWVRSKKALVDIRDLCISASVPLLVCDHSQPPVTALPDFCRAQGIAYAPLRFSEDDYRSGIALSLMDAHANARGHGILLENLRRELLERKLLPE